MDCKNTEATLYRREKRTPLGSDLHVLASQQPLLVAEQQAITLSAQRFDTKVQLNAALDGGLQPTNDTRADSSPLNPPPPFDTLAEVSHGRR